MKLTEDWNINDWKGKCVDIELLLVWNEIPREQIDEIKSKFSKQQILENQENISPDKTLEYVLENYYDEVREAVFEQEAENRRE